MRILIYMPKRTIDIPYDKCRIIYRTDGITICDTVDGETYKFDIGSLKETPGNILNQLINAYNAGEKYFEIYTA